MLFQVALLVASLVVAQAKPRLVSTRTWTYNGKQVVGTLHASSPTICDKSVKQYSGYFSAGGNKQYFYWFFESRSSPSSDPLTMWLSGGPGCSSMLALFAENGPCKVTSDGTSTTNNPYSWNTKSNVMYVDQPPGTGFSKGTEDHGEDGVATDMFHFLQAFMAAYGQYFKNGYYLFGESYAGHYVPAISYKIFTENQMNNFPKIPLKGIAIGNGLTDPEVQYSYYAQMAFNSTTAPHVIDRTVFNEMTAAIPRCISDIQACQSNQGDCVTALDYCNGHEISPVQQTGINLYDLRIKCAVPPLCYDFSNVGKYLNLKSVQEQIGVNTYWQSCNFAVNSKFESDWMKDFQMKIPPQLANGTHVLIYAGDQDFICNYLGNQAWSLQMKWPGQEGFNKAVPKEFSNGGKPMGMLRSYMNFHFLQVYQAGHMAPMDQPQATLYMLDQFTQGAL